MADESEQATVDKYHPLALIDKAIAKGVDADYMGKLMDLAERHQRNLAVQAFSEAMNACQIEMPNVVKDATNTHTKTRYTKFESMNAICKPVFTGHGFSISYGEEDCPIEGSLRLIADVRHIEGHCQRYHIDVPLDGTGIKGNQMMTGTQGKGSTISYARRYLLKMIFNVAEADEDNDGNEAEPVITKDQVETLQRFMEKGYPDAGSMKQFLVWLKHNTGTDSIDKIPANKFKWLLEMVRKAGQEARKGDAHE